MFILVIDPGTATVGFGLIDVDVNRAPVALAYGVIQTDKALPMPERLATIYADMADLLADGKPDVLALEELFFLKNINTAMPVAQARGVIMLAAAHAGVPVTGYSPAQVKMNVAGHGKAQKVDVQEAVRDLLNLESIPRPDDAADGLAIALTHWYVIEGRGEVPKPRKAAPESRVVDFPSRRGDMTLEEADEPWPMVATGGADPELSEGY
jgi:crossover junction endodeoxyribonuclease RuvC